jgi:hypothetical protein
MRRRLDDVDMARIKMLRLSGKALDFKKAKIAVLQTQNHRFRKELKSRVQNRRKTIRENPNNTFIRIEQIKEAQRAIGEMAPVAEASGSQVKEEDIIYVG